MDCRICMEKKQLHDITELNCGHKMCFICLDRLIKNCCPYCRETIDGKENGDYGIEYEITVFDITNDITDTNTEIDHTLPMSELYYIEDLFYEDSYDIIHANRTKKDKNENKRRNNCSRKKNFTSNKNREPWERKKKKWKKVKN